MSRDWDSEKEQEEMDGKNVENGYTPKLMYERLSKRLGSLFTFSQNQLLKTYCHHRHQSNTVVH